MNIVALIKIVVFALVVFGPYSVNCDNYVSLTGVCAYNMLTSAVLLVLLRSWIRSHIQIW